MPSRVSRRRSQGQVIIETLLLLPIFLTIVFMILELGNIAFHMILIQHATWETARHGAMTSAPKGGGSFGAPSKAALEDFIKRIIKDAKIESAVPEAHGFMDPQAQVFNADLVVTSRYAIPLIFPITSILMSKPPGSGKHTVLVTVRMPIEQPLFK